MFVTGLAIRTFRLQLSRFSDSLIVFFRETRKQKVEDIPLFMKGSS